MCKAIFRKTTPVYNKGKTTPVYNKGTTTPDYNKGKVRYPD